jgi:hypothetical protein
MHSPFEGGRHEPVFNAMLSLRFAHWRRSRRNLLARRRYAERKRIQRATEGQT